MRWTWLALLVVLLVACGPSRRRWRPREVSGPGSAAFVVVPMATPLRTAPSRRAPALRVLRPRRRAIGVGQRLAVMRILRERGGWAELESPGPLDDGHCAEEIDALRSLRLRLFVPSSALVPVTVRSVVQTFADDTSVALRRGVPVEPLPGTRLHRARLGAFSAVLRLAVSETGTRYLPEDRPASGSALGYVSARVLTEGRAVLGQTGRLATEHPELAIPYFSQTPRGPTERVVELRPRCATIHARVPTEGVDVDLLLRGARVGEAPSESAAVEAGAAVYWEDGREAGLTAERLAFASELDGDGGRRCFAHPLGPFEEDPTVTLCFDAADVLNPGAGLGARLARP